MYDCGTELVANPTDLQQGCGQCGGHADQYAAIPSDHDKCQTWQPCWLAVPESTQCKVTLTGK